MSLIPKDVENGLEKVLETVEKAPLAVKAIRIFMGYALAGQPIADALKKTAEIIALEELL